MFGRLATLHHQSSAHSVDLCPHPLLSKLSGVPRLSVHLVLSLSSSSQPLNATLPPCSLLHLPPYRRFRSLLASTVSPTPLCLFGVTRQAGRPTIACTGRMSSKLPTSWLRGNSNIYRLNVRTQEYSFQSCNRPSTVTMSAARHPLFAPI